MTSFSRFQERNKKRTVANNKLNTSFIFKGYPSIEIKGSADQSPSRRFDRFRTQMSDPGCAPEAWQAHRTSPKAASQGKGQPQGRREEACRKACAQSLSQSPHQKRPRPQG